MDVGLTKMSTKGQIVIPSDLRDEFVTGEKLLVIRNQNQLIIKKASEMDKDHADDIAFAKKTEEAWQRIQDGKGVRMDFDDFMKEMDSW